MAVLDGHAGTECVNYLEKHIASRVLNCLAGLLADSSQTSQPLLEALAGAAGTAKPPTPTSAFALVGGTEALSIDAPQPLQPLQLFGAGTTIGCSGASSASGFSNGWPALPCQDALRTALLACEQELVEADVASGSTALLALVVDDHTFLANVGDCRAVVCDDGEARQLTRDHKPEANLQERARLAAAGAHLSTDGYVQVCDHP